MKARLEFQFFATCLFVCCLGATLLVRPVEAQSAPQVSSAQSTSTLAVHVVGLRNAKGNVRVKIMRGGDFVDLRVVPIDAASQTADVVFDKLPKGDYSVSLFHDENLNGKLDSNLFGMPVEGYGFSNNPPKGFGPPKPELTTFALKQPKSVIEIRLIYW
jgi:uncharacterized protein (DUF2141 family)